MANAISTTKKLIQIAAVATASTPIFESLSQKISKEYTAGSSATVNVEMNSYPIFTDGANVSTDSDILIKETPVTLGIVAATMGVGTIEKELDLESFDRQVAKPAGVSFAAKAESKLSEHILFSCDNVTVSTGTFAQLSALQAAIKGTKFGKQMIGFLPPELHAIIAQSGVNLFGQSLGEKLYAGEIGQFMGCKWYESTDLPIIETSMVPTVTTTTVTSEVKSDGATEIGLSNLPTATGTIKKGTVFALTGVKTVNVLGIPTASPKYFTVQEDATVATSAATVKVAPIYFKKASGVQDPRCNISVTKIATGTTVAFSPMASGSTYIAGVCFDPSVIAYGAKGLTKFEDQGAASESIVVGSLSLRIGRASNMTNGSQKVRLDSLMGFQTVYGRATGATYYKVS